MYIDFTKEHLIGVQCMRDDSQLMVGSQNASLLRSRQLILARCSLVTSYHAIDLGQYWFRQPTSIYHQGRYENFSWE